MKYTTGSQLRSIDLFCGIGGFRIGFAQACEETGFAPHCVFSSEIDKRCQDAYEANFGERPEGDITQIDEHSVPDHDLLMAGFPCQPFSIIGRMRGLEDTRGTLFFDIARILKAKRPGAFLLENVKMLRGHNGGRTLEIILKTLREELGYQTDWRILNALDFGLPQKRERIFIVGFREPAQFDWPQGGAPMTALSKILDKEAPEKFNASERIRANRLKQKQPNGELTIWHENKSGNISVLPYSCALRAGASYNYLLVNGERRLTPRETLRLQGFPESYKIVCSDHQTRKQTGNAVPVPVVKAVLGQMLEAMKA